MKQKQRRVYFCRPCGKKHPSPTNAKCPQKGQPKGKPSKQDKDSSGETAKTAVSEHHGPARTLRGSRPPANKRRREIAETSVVDEEPDEPEAPEQQTGSMSLILSKLENIAAEGREARRQLAAEGCAERQELRATLAALQSQSSEEIVSDEDIALPTHNTEGAKGVPASGPSHGASNMTPSQLVRASNPLQSLRADKPSAVKANEILTRGGACADEVTRKIKSGFLLTVNDSVNVQAQWPHLNVHRSTSKPAMYDSLTINEFCSGYMVFVNECLEGDEPNVPKALDYISYLRDLLDEIPLMEWPAVRDAHGEILRQIEQNRLNWDDVGARTKQLNKAFRRAHLEGLGESIRGGQPAQPQLVKRPCTDYQTKCCTVKGSHVEDGVKLLHCCATCYKLKKQKYGHPKVECRKQKLLNEKNLPKND